MSYKEKPIIKLYAYKNNAFELVALIDDYQEASIEHNYHQAGQFTITINYNIPNAKLFERGLFVQLGDSPDDFGEIASIQDSIGDDGKGSQRRLITGYDARYLLKRRIIKNLNSNGMWKMTAKGELCLRNLIADQCGANAEEKRRLPIINTIPATADAIGEEYSVSEQFTNLYDVCCTIATQSKIGWKIVFSGLSLTLECYEGEDLSNSVFFSTDFESLKDGTFTDTSDSYTNAVYIGGKGQNDERDIYEGEDGSPAGIGRFESWDDQSQMTSDEEYEAEALSMLAQYGQTVNIDGNGLAKSPYIFRSEYDIGDSIKINFSDRTAVAQILSVTERWAWSQYDINFSFGKPQNNLAEQIQLILRKIQMSSNNGSYIDSVKWYTIPTDTEMTADDVTYNTLGFTGAIGNSNRTFTIYFDNMSKTGSKSYTVYAKNLTGSGKLILTTGVTDSETVELPSGSYVASLYVNEEGDVVSTFMGIVNEVNTLTDEVSTIEQAISSGAIPTFDIVYPVGCTYTQFPNCPSPNELWGSISIWTELNFGGAFFRASGGNAKTFNSGSQGDSVKSHTHSGTTNEMSGDTYGSVECASEGLFNGRGTMTTGGRFSLSNNRNWAGGDNNEANRPGKLYLNLSHTHGLTIDSNDTSATENRPFNYTVKIWKRTA